MVDMVKRIKKKCPEAILPGEELLAASVVGSTGQFKKNVAFGAIGGLAGAAVGHAMSGKGTDAAPGPMAGPFTVGKQAILAVTDQRWILFEQGGMSGSPKEIQAQCSRADAVLSIERGRLVSKLRMRFTDKSLIEMESVNGAKPGKLVDAAG